MGFRAGTAQVGETIPAGTAVGDILVWDGTAWMPAPRSNMRGLCVAGFAALSFGAAANGQLPSNLQSDMSAAAPALPDNFGFYGNPLPSVGGRLIGFEIMLHANVGTGTATNWHVSVNSVVQAAFNVTLGAAARRIGIWPAAAVPFVGVVANYLSVTFDMGAPIVGSYRPSAVVYFEANALAPPL